MHSCIATSVASCDMVNRGMVYDAGRVHTDVKDLPARTKTGGSLHVLALL